MTLFKSLFLMVCLCLAATIQSAFAAGGAPSGPSNGQYYCSASDKGWEEHYGGHSSCGECLAKHGNCVERCYEKSYSCTATGLAGDGKTESFEGYSDFSEYDARNQALNRCSYNNRSCSISTCTSNDNLVSSRGC